MVHKFLFLLAALAMGCSLPSEQTPNLKPKIIVRDQTLEWRSLQRGGAAIRGHGYTHVVGDYGFESDVQYGQIAANEVGNYGYSLYELNRWYRFCAQEAGMDGRDRQYTQSVDQQDLSVELIPSCNSPK